MASAQVSQNGTSSGLLPSSSTFSRPNLDGMLLLEQPFARVPFDELRRQQRTQQRLIEREMVFCSSSLNELESKVVRGVQPQAASSAQEEVEKSLDAMLGRLRGLKRKMTPIAEQSKQALRMAQSRTDHLAALHSIESSASPDFADWTKTRLDRMLVDYTLRRGYRDSAEELARTRGIQDLVDLDLFAEIVEIEKSLVPPGWQPHHDHQQKAELPLPESGKRQKAEDDVEPEMTSLAATDPAATASVTVTASDAHGPSGTGSGVKSSCSLALAWCSENKTMLRKIKSPLEFDLRLQEYVELARVRTPESIKEAIAYLRRHLLPMQAAASAAALASSNAAKSGDKKGDDKEAEYDRSAHEAIRKQISRAMGLIACGPDGWAYEDLYTPYRWLSLRDSFRVCALQIHTLPLQPVLHIALSAGLSSLKVPACYSHEAHTQNGTGTGTATGAPGHLGGRTAADAATASLLLDGSSNTSHSGFASDAVSIPSRFPPAMGGSSAEISGTSAATAVAASTTAAASGTANLSAAEGAASTPLNYLGSMMSSGINPHPSALHAHSRSHSPNPATAPESARDDRNIDCPICDTDGLGTLAREVPWSHHANSTLVCSLSGKMMDENNPPMALPNGRVYAMAALEEMAANSKDGSTIVCPRTGERFAMSSLRKVFIS